MSRLHEEGYERLTPHPAYNAVRWWYVEVDGDFVYARGGHVRTSRLARRELETARNGESIDRLRRSKRPTHRLARDGDLVPL